MKVFLLTIEAMPPNRNSPSDAVELHFSSGEYNKDGEDWEPRLKQPSLYVEKGHFGDYLNISSSASFGDSILVNVDGGLDYLSDYSLDGRVARMDVYDTEDGSKSRLFLARVGAIGFTTKEVTISLTDWHSPLFQNHPQDVYKGDNVLPNGVEGTADDLKGVRKPKVFGSVHNATPYMVNSSKLIYQVSSGACEIPAVYDRGVPLTRGEDYWDIYDMEGTAPAAGTYRTLTVGAGYFRIGASPSGTITCDAIGKSFHYPYPAGRSKISEVFNDIVVDAGFTATGMSPIIEIEEVGVYVKDPIPTSEMLNFLANSSRSYWTRGSLYSVHMRPFKINEYGEQFDHNDPPIITLEDYQILNLERQSTGGGTNGAPVWKSVVEYDKVETVQSDLAGSVPEEAKARKSVKYRKTSDEDITIKEVINLSSEEKVVTTVLRNEADAIALATSYGKLLSVRRDTVSVRTREEHIRGATVGGRVFVYSNYLGYSNGRHMTITSIEYNLRKQEVTLNLFG